MPKKAAPKKSKAAKKKADFLKLPVNKQVEAVNDALAGEVYMTLAMHGGGIEIMDIKGTEIFIKYYGACVGCPFAESGAELAYIEKILQEKVDPRIRVKTV